MTHDELIKRATHRAPLAAGVHYYRWTHLGTYEVYRPDVGPFWDTRYGSPPQEAVPWRYADSTPEVARFKNGAPVDATHVRCSRVPWVSRPFRLYYRVPSHFGAAYDRCVNGRWVAGEKPELPPGSQPIAPAEAPPAAVTVDAVLKQAAARGLPELDVYKATAAVLFDVKPSEVTDEMRKLAKELVLLKPYLR